MKSVFGKFVGLVICVFISLGTGAVTLGQSALTTHEATGFGHGGLSVNVIYGWDFSFNKDGFIQELAIFDGSGNGLFNAHEVGIFTTGGTLLTSVTVPQGSAATLAGPFDSGGLLPAAVFAIPRSIHLYQWLPVNLM